MELSARFKAAIFDMDGTLLDSMRYWRLGSIEYLLYHQLPVPEEILSDVFTRSGIKTLELAMQKLSMAFDRPTMSAEMCERMSYHYQHDVKPKPFALEYVKALTAQGIRCCVATATPRGEAAAALEHCGFTPYLDFVTDEEEIGYPKRDGMFFEQTASKIGFKVGECALFEDSLYAVNAAKSVGMWTCAIEEASAAADREGIIAASDKYIRSFDEML